MEDDCKPSDAKSKTVNPKIQEVLKKQVIKLLDAGRIYPISDINAKPWVEAKALPINDACVVVKFLKSLFARFGTPRATISDHGTHFCNDQFAKVISKYGVTNRLATAYHPQTSGQVEVLNRGLKRILERTVRENRASWSDKLDDALRGRRSFMTKENKNQIFNVGDQVLLFNSRLKIFSGKLKTRWSGPFTIAQVYPYGTVELSQPDGLNFKVNGHRVKHYFGGDIPSKVRISQKSQENIQKTGNHEHGKRKSTREAKDSKPKPEKVKLQSKVVKKSKKVNSQSTSVNYGVKSVISMPSLAHLVKESHVDVGKHTRMMDFALLTLTKQAQMSHHGLPA
ncbi:reverse transcriptase domain-containing protein [Tanacetum coccineum]